MCVLFWGGEAAGEVHFHSLGLPNNDYSPKTDNSSVVPDIHFNPNGFPSTALDLLLICRATVTHKSCLRFCPHLLFQRAGNANFHGITIISMVTHRDVTKTRTSMCNRIRRGTALQGKKEKAFTFADITGR